MQKPRIFIASSAESLPIAEAVNVNLDHEFEVSLWRTGTLKLSSTAIDDLITRASSVDFALFVFAPEDLSIIRDETEHVVRDNVVFELGLFIGSIGKERCFILKPRAQDMHLPSDLIGTNFADFDHNRADGDLGSATNAACTDIKKRSSELGVITQTTLAAHQRLQSNPPRYDLVGSDYEFLSACLESHTSSPYGLPFHVICNNTSGAPNNYLRIAAAKLERMNLIEKSIMTDERDGYDYYGYSITEQGIDKLLAEPSNRSGSPDDAFDEDIPF